MSRPERGAVVLFALVAVLLCGEGLRPGRVLVPTALDSLPPWSEGSPEARGPSNPLMGDSLQLTVPARLYNHEMLRKGELPFWNPHIYCGYPHLALIQNNALYPLTLPFDLVAPLAGIGWSLCLHLALAGALMYAFLRRTGLGVPAALVGGLAFELNGLFLVRMGAPSYIYSGTWLPLMLIGSRALAEAPAGRAALALPVGVALSVLGGHPQIAALAILIAAAYAGWRTFDADSSAPEAGARARVLVRGGLLVSLGLGLAACALVPFVELVLNSARDAVPLELYRRSAVPLVSLVQAILPDVFGHPVHGDYWFGRTAPLLDTKPGPPPYWGLNYTGQNVFTGVAPLVLALFAIFRSPRRAEVQFFGLVALAALTVLLGTPVLDLAWAVVPGFRHSRPDRVIFLYMAAVAVLAAHGYEAGRGAEAGARRGVPAARWVGWGLLGLLALRGAATGLRPGQLAATGRWLAEAAPLWAAERAHLAGQALAAVAVVAGLLFLRRRPGLATRPAGVALAVGLVVIPSLQFGWRFNPAQAAPHPGGTAMERLLLDRHDLSRIARILAQQPVYLPPNVPQLLGLDDVHGASAAGLEPYLRLMETADSTAVRGGKYFNSFRSPRVADGPLLRLLSVEYVASDADLALPRVTADGGAVALFREPAPLPRFYVVESVEPYDDETGGRRRLMGGFDAGRTVLLPAAQAGSHPGPAPGPPAVAASVRRYAPHAIELDVDTPEGGVLVSSEAAYPGWESRVDGRTAETLLVNTAFRGVAVPPGPHRVTMTYVPRTFQVGLALSLVALVLTATLARRR